MTRFFNPTKAVRILLILALGALLVPGEAPAKKKKQKKPAENEAVVVGTVTDVDDKVIAGARVKVTSSEQSDFETEATADDQGVFTVRIVDPQGQYVFHLEADGYASFSGEVPLTVGEQANIGFKMLDYETGRRQEAVRAFNEGVQLFNQEDFSGAKSKFLAATENDPEMVEPFQGLAEIYYREKDLDQAAAAIDKFLAAKGEEPNALTLAYTIYREKGDTARTEQLIDSLAKTDRAKPLARKIYNEGVAATQKGDDDGAIARFRRAASLDPELAPAYSSEATVLYNASRYQEAAAALEKLFALDGSNKQGRRIHFLIYDALSDPEKSGAALDAYLAVDVDGAVDLMYQRADMDFRDNNPAKAIVALEKILELRPEMPRAHYTLGLCHMSGDQGKAKTHLERFIELAPEDPEVAAAKEMLSYLK